MLSTIIDLCNRYSIRLSQRLSQNFLHAKHILDRQIQIANVRESDVVLDIGAGFGFLTEEIAKKARKVYAIEIDGRLVRVLRSRLKRYIEDGKVCLIRGDALKVEWPDDVNKVVSNPPYHIISQLLFKMFQKYFLKPDFDLAVMIAQYDFAKKLIAKPGERRSKVSATAQYFSEIKIVSRISRKNFFPVPEVDSALVVFLPRRINHIVEFSVYKKTVFLLFNSPNRTLRKILVDILPDGKLGEVADSIRSYGINIKKRIRELTNEELERLAFVLKKAGILA